MMIKPAEFLGDTIEALRAFPEHARQDAGFQLDKVQRGEEPDDWKKTQETSEKDIKLARSRFKELMRKQP